MFFLKRAFNAPSGCSRCSGDNPFLVLPPVSLRSFGYPHGFTIHLDSQFVKRPRRSVGVDLEPSELRCTALRASTNGYRGKGVSYRDQPEKQMSERHPAVGTEVVRANGMSSETITRERDSAGDPIPAKCAVIEVQVAELKQLFNSIDPSPFRNRDLDPKAEEFIVGWAKDLPHDVRLALVIDLDRPAGLPDEAAVLRDAIHEFFSQRAQTYRRRLRELFRVGRTSLAVGLVALAAAIALGDFLAVLMKGSRLAEILRESLVIGGWVSMWRPLEIFLYDWWPIRNEARLSDRLAAMPVRIRYINDAAPDAWRGDWPAVSPRSERVSTQDARPT